MTVHSQLARHGLFDARVPRYTSYPTAPQFSDGFGEAQLRSLVNDEVAKIRKP